MKRTTLLWALVLIGTGLQAQFFQNNEWSQALPWRNIGPANMMGRIAAVEAHPEDYRKVLVATASGGVVKSNNGGITWDVIFDRYGANSIGSVAMFAPDPDIIWVGTGESANRNSSGWGNGLFRSTDGGKTFQYAGLANTHHIAEIALHPTDPEIAYVAAVGHLWGYSGERGLFMTSDGGATWTKLTNGLPDDGLTGCTEVIMHPEDPNTLFAGFYHRLRRPFHYQSGGEAGGMFKSTDGGKTWRKLTAGLPTGATGMIDISIHLADPQIMVAAVETDENLPEGVPGSGVYRSDDGGESWRFLLKHAVRPFYHGQICIDPIDPDNIYVVSRDFRISTDGGKTFGPRRWRTDGGDDHDMWIAPYDSKIMYLATDQGLRLTVDGGRSFLSFNNMAIGQYYAIGVDMRDPYWVIGGLQDNGLWMLPSNSRERRGILNMHVTWVGEGDGFHAQIDPTDYRTAYIVNHVGFAARLNVDTREYAFITPTPESTVNFTEFADPDFPETPIRYTIDPGEHWFFGERPERPPLPPQFRFNWSSPLVMSPNNPETIYFGGNYLFKSVDKGKTWRIISPDLTTNDPEKRNPTNSGGLTRSVTGGENYCTIITIGESPADPSVVWAGTDDGNLQVTRNGGVTWTNVKPRVPGVPAEAWVSRVTPSHFAPGTCYVTFDNHRYDDFRVYVYKTEDYGQTWKAISGDLPDGYSAYVIKEDPVRAGLLFLGTENAVFATINDGDDWFSLMHEMPTVAVHDLVIHPRDADLVAGTHGRSIWILEDITPLRQMAAEVAEKPLHLFNQRMATKWRRIDTGRKQPAFEFRGGNPPRGGAINFWVNAPVDSVWVTIREFGGPHQTRNRYAVDQGLNRIHWYFSFPRTTAELEAYKAHLQQVIRTLSAKVKQPQLLTHLETIQVDLETAVTMGDLNDVRRYLVEQYSVYAEGAAFFGEKMTAWEAPAGRYEVVIEAGTHRTTGYLDVRDDPMVQDW